MQKIFIALFLSMILLISCIPKESVISSGDSPSPGEPFDPKKYQNILEGEWEMIIDSEYEYDPYKGEFIEFSKFSASTYKSSQLDETGTRAYTIIDTLYILSPTVAVIQYTIRDLHTIGNLLRQGFFKYEIIGNKIYRSSKFDLSVNGVITPGFSFSQVVEAAKKSSVNKDKEYLKRKE